MLIAMKAMLLDRDDTIIDTQGVTAGSGHVGDLLDASIVKLLPGVGPALRSLQDAGFMLVLYTSQGGVARGIGSIAQVEQVNDALRSALAPFGVTLGPIYYCPFHPTGSVPRFTFEHDWRKPAPGMLTTARDELGLDLSQCYAAGDKPRDVEAAVSAGVPRERCFLLATSGEGPADAADLPEACRTILAAETAARAHR